MWQTEDDSHKIMSKKARKTSSKNTPAKSHGRTGWLIVLAAAIALVAVLAYWKHTDATRGVAASSMPQPGSMGTAASFQPTIENKAKPSGTAPDAMVWIPGGEFSMGAADSPSDGEMGMQATTDSRPIHRVYVDGFYMDKTDVTNAEFAKFVKATSYITVAERKPRAEDFPGAPPENLVAGSVVFSPPDHRTLRQAICVGRRLPAARQVDGEYAPGALPR